MSLGNPINIRLPIEKQFQYEREAQIKGLPLRTYLRERLCESDQIKEALSDLRKEVLYLSMRVEQIPQTKHQFDEDQVLDEIRMLKSQMESFMQNDKSIKNSSSVNETGILLELLLLLRQIAQPERMRIAGAELKRLGIPVWTSDK